MPEARHSIKKDVMLWNTAQPYLYLRETPDDRIIIGGRDEAFYNPAKRDKLISRKSNLLVRDYHRLFPDTPFRSEFSWTGTFGTTADGLPFIGAHPRFRNSYFALGFGGNGITFSVIAAAMIRDVLTGKKNRDKKLFSFERA
jgi:glycine/D-amino acid oxidase-like deaminating enzyme